MCQNMTGSNASLQLLNELCVKFHNFNYRYLLLYVISKNISLKYFY
jgi:hypothetical protein